jgi:hypothetical protein
MKWWQLDFFRSCGASMIQRRFSLKAQGAAENGCAKVLQSYFFLEPVRKEIPDLQPNRYAIRAIEITIAILPHKMCSSRSCFVQSSPQRFIKAAPLPPPPGHRARTTRKRKKRGGWHVLRYPLPAYCLVYKKKRPRTAAPAPHPPPHTHTHALRTAFRPRLPQLQQLPLDVIAHSGYQRSARV